VRLLLLIFASSTTSLIAAWFLTGGLSAAEGDPVISVLIAFAVALLWARDYNRLEEAYIRGHFDVVRRKLRLWAANIGPGEAALVRLSMAAESGSQSSARSSIAEANRLGFAPFARGWLDAMVGRAHADTTDEDVARFFVDAAQGVGGYDRAELYCEAAIVLLQQPRPDRATARRAAEYVSEAALALDDLDPGVGGRQRHRYLETFARGIRAMLQGTGGGGTDAIKALAAAQEAAKRLPTPRGRRLEQLFRIERALAVWRGGDRAAAGHELELLREVVVLPSLRTRLRAAQLLVAGDPAEAAHDAPPPRHAGEQHLLEFET
jgi:hypothetical protein